MNILQKFDEAKALATKAISVIDNDKIVLQEKRDSLVKYEKELKERESDVKKTKSAIASAQKLLKTQDELDRLKDDVKARLQTLENEEKQQRVSYVKKENELIAREDSIGSKEKELEDGFARLKKDKASYKEKIIKSMAKNLGGK